MVMHVGAVLPLGVERRVGGITAGIAHGEVVGDVVSIGFSVCNRIECPAPKTTEVLCAATGDSRDVSQVVSGSVNDSPILTGGFERRVSRISRPRGAAWCRYLTCVRVCGDFEMVS
jgi:hypothetical protein